MDKLRGKQLIPKSLRVDIEKPSVEPMLWMPDIVAGIVGAARNGDSMYLDLMRQTVTELSITLH